MEKVKKAVLLLFIPFGWLGYIYSQYKVARKIISWIFIADIVILGLIFNRLHGVPLWFVFCIGFVIYAFVMSLITGE